MTGYPEFTTLLKKLIVLLILGELAGCKTLAASSNAAPAEVAGDLHVCGFAFPAGIGSFRRLAVSHYGQADCDISVGYRSSNGITASVDVYPGHQQNLAAEFAARAAEIEHFHAGATRPATSSSQVSPQGIAALSASYEYSDNFGGTVMPVRSDLLVAAHGDQFVEYRFTWPAFSLSAPDEVHYFEQTFAWP